MTVWNSDILRIAERYVVYQVFIRCVFEHARVDARALAPSPLSLIPSHSIFLLFSERELKYIQTNQWSKQALFCCMHTYISPSSM